VAHECQIYVLFDENGAVNYVGRTARAIKWRMYEHRQVQSGLQKFWTDLRADPERYAAYVGARGKKLSAYLKSPGAPKRERNPATGQFA
jgi:hypothetical protein